MLEVLSDASIPENHFEDFTKFGVLCLESLTYQISKDESGRIPDPHFIETILTCSDVIFRQSNLCSILGLDSHCSWFCSAVNSIFTFVRNIFFCGDNIPSVECPPLKQTLDNLETLSAGHACFQLAALILWIEKTQTKSTNIPEFFYDRVKSIIISLSRLPLVNSFVLNPAVAWERGWDVELIGSFNTQVPPLPIEYLQEIDILEEFVFRMTLLGWTSRQQFEEMWMSLLSVLNANVLDVSNDTNLISDEVNSMVHAASLAVQAITALLLQTLLEPVPGNPHISKWIHVPRDNDIHIASNNQFKLINKKLRNKYQSYCKLNSVEAPLIHIFKNSNLERTTNNNYGFSQVSVEYLWIASKIAEATDENNTASLVHNRRQNYLVKSGLDLHSCLQFLLDLYTQWIKPQDNTPLRLLREVVRSVFALSDIFTEKSQFTWMLEEFLNLSKFHPTEDEILHQYIILGTCKAVAILTPDLETYEHVKKMLAISLKSGFLPARIASLHGVLYLLQSSVIGNTIIGGQSEDAQLILPVAVEYIQTHIIAGNR